jgi:hypothetical protein
MQPGLKFLWRGSAPTKLLSTRWRSSQSQQRQEINGTLYAELASRDMYMEWNPMTFSRDDSMSAARCHTGRGRTTFSVRRVRVRAAQPHTTQRAASSRTRCGGQERRSRHIGSEAGNTFRNQQLEIKPPSHEKRLPGGAINAHPSYRCRGFCGYVVPRVCVARHICVVTCLWNP